MICLGLITLQFSGTWRQEPRCLSESQPACVPAIELQESLVSKGEVGHGNSSVHGYSVLSPVTKGQSSTAKGTSKKILTLVHDPEERNSLIYHAVKRTFFQWEKRPF